LRTKVNDLNTQLRAEKQNIVRLEMEKQQVAHDLNELKDELVKVKGNEKRLKTELQEEKLKNSRALQEAMLMSQAKQQNGMTLSVGAQPLGYQGYLARQRGGQGMITGKVGMQSKFMNYEKLKGESPQVQPQASMAAQRRASVLPNPLGFSSGRPKRQGLGLSNNVHEMLGAAGIKADSSLILELEEDMKPDYTAEAFDDLD